VVWAENQTGHNISLSQCLIQSKALSSVLWRQMRKLSKKSP
jgi:hypothetical protein